MAHVPKTGPKSRPPGERPKSWPEPAGPEKVGAEGDAELVRRAQGGEMAAYEELVRRHQRRVLAIVGGILRRSEDIEDVAQQVFIKVFVSLKRFDLRSTFTTWLYKVTVNECWDYLRKKRARRLVYDADLSEEQSRQVYGGQAQSALGGEAGRQAHGEPGEVAFGGDAARRTELRDLLERLMSHLPREERLMLVLKEVEGFSVEEIGAVLDLNVNTVKVRLFRARGKLMALYRKRLENPPEKRAGKREGG